MSDAVKDMRKLCIMNAKETDSDDTIRTVCEQFGTLIHFNRPPAKKNLCFPLYVSESDARNAKEGLSKEGYRVNYANDGREKRSEESRSRQNLSDLDADYVEPDSSEQGDRPYGICIKCGGKAYMNCQRCHDFYCSADCQSLDWLTHKRNCFPMPKLVPSRSIPALNALASYANNVKSTEKLQDPDGDNTDGQPNVSRSPRSNYESPRNNRVREAEAIAVSRHSDQRSVADKSVKNQAAIANTNGECEKISPRQKLMQSVSNGEVGKSPAPAALATPAQVKPGHLTSVTIPNDSNVYITHVKTYSNVYIRSAETNDAYTKLMTEVEVASNVAPKLNGYPNREDIVMAPFDGMYFRACVIKSEEASGTVKVGYIDFGNWFEVPFGTLRKLPEHLGAHPRQAIMVSLKNSKEDAETHEASRLKDHLETLCNEETLLRVNGDKAEISAKDSVELFNVVSNSSINKELNKLVQKRYRLSDLVQNVVNGTNLGVMAIESDRLSDDIITCILKKDVNAFMAGDQKVQDYGASVKNAPAYSPKVKELCVVKIKEAEGDVWYRCVYQQELVEEKAQVFCIDYGRINKVQANNIRALTSALDHQIVSFMCTIKDGNNIPMEKKKAFVDDPECVAKEIEYKDDIHVITLNV